MVQFVSVLMVFVLLGIVECRSIPDGKILEECSADRSQKWGYVEVREMAHMFYWHYNTSHAAGVGERPWIIWLQGGPGASSCGYGNFEIIGPLNRTGQPRDTTWVKEASVLFIDYPVGAGFSYVENETAYNTEVGDIIDDLVIFLREFIRRTPVFKTRSLYIFGQSYGGKVVTFLGRRLYEESQSGQIEINPIGVALGNAWIAPIDSVFSYGGFAYAMGLTDEHGRYWVDYCAHTLNKSMEEGNFTAALDQFWEVQRYLNNYTYRVYIYDITKYFSDFDNATTVHSMMEYQKNTTLKNVVPEKKTYQDNQSDILFDKLGVPFMKPSYDDVAYLLEKTDLQVIVYQGSFDIIVPTKATMEWVQKMPWSKLDKYNSAKRKPLINPTDNQTEGFVKAYDKFKFYTILGSGHAVPRDKPDAAYRMLDRILRDVDK